MPSSYKVLIRPVEENRDEVTTVLMRYLPPGSEDQVNALIEEGGEVITDLNEAAARQVQEQLAEAGAEARVVMADDTGDSLPDVLPGRVRDPENNRLVEGAEVTVQSAGRGRTVTFGSATSNADGEFTLPEFGARVREFFPEERPELDVTVVIDGREVDARHKPIDWEEYAAGDHTLIVEVVPPESTEDQDVYTVAGQVLRPDGSPATGVTVRSSDRDLRTEQRLGKATTGSDGQYEITYTADRFTTAEADGPDLVVRAYDQQGTELPADSDRENTIFNATRDEVVNLQLEESPTEPSEYTQLARALEPVLRDVEPADLTSDDVRFLANDTGRNKTRIRLFQQDAALAEEYQLPKAVFYGFARREIGLVEGENGARIDLGAVLDHDNATLREHLKGALDEKIIPARLREQLEDILNRLAGLRKQERERRRSEWPQHELSGQLLEEESEEPLVRYSIRVTRETDQDLYRVDEALTDADGAFEVDYRAPADEAASRTFQFTVRSPTGTELGQLERTITPESEETVTLRVSTPTELVPGEDKSLEGLSTDLSNEAIEALADAGVTTLADVRSVGDLTSVDGVSEAQATRLQAYATLSVLPVDEAEQSQLIESGFESPVDIATTPRAEFTQTVDGSLSQPNRIYDGAVAAKRAIDDQITGFRKNWANGVKTKDLLVPDDYELPPTVPQPCRCRDCESAVSPGAYLATLLRYTVENVSEGSDDITLSRLEELFHQPFGDLPNACEQSQQQVRQARICIEALLGHLGESDIQFLTDPTGEGGEYRKQAYNSLLTELGTSQEELRLIQAADPDEQLSLADQLGIAVDHLDQLLFNPTAALGSTSSGRPLSEDGLESIFGLRAFTYYDDATDSLTIPDPLREIDEPNLRTWRLQHLRDQWSRRDHPSDVFSEERRPLIDPDVVTPDDFRTPDPSASTAFNIWRQRREWVDDRVAELRGTTESVTFDGETVDVPDLEAMLSDVLATPTTYTDVQGTQRTETPWSRTPTLEEFRSLRNRLNSGADEASVVETITEEFSLSVESFTRFVELWEKDAKWSTDRRNPRVTESEWREVRSILTQAQKRSFYGWWMWQEQNLDVVLRPEEFWVSLHEPERGQWSAAILDSHRPSDPFIDPERVDLSDLPDATAGEGAIALWEDRQETLAQKRSDLWDTYRQNGFDAVLNTDVYTQGPPAGYSNWDDYFGNRPIADIASDLSLPDQEAASKLQAVRADALGGSGSDDGSTPPSDEELADIFAMLTSAWKRREKYSGWFQTEKQDLLTSDDKYWRVRKARLPKWRAGPSARQEWQQALQTRSQPPIVEPDLLVPSEDFEDPTPGNTVFDLWQARKNKLSNDLQTLKNTTPNTALVTDVNNEVNQITDLDEFSDSLADRLSGYPVQGILENPGEHSPSDLTDYLSEDITLFNRLLKEAVGVSLRELVALGEQQQQGNGIDARLAQLTLTRPGFEHLLDVHERLAKGVSVQSAVWKQVHHLLVAVQKRRRYAEWRHQERATYVLDLDPSFSDDLNEGTLSSSLRTAFQNQGAGLSSDVTVTTLEPGRRWRLQDAGNDRTYTIETGRVKRNQGTPGRTLQVYLRDGKITGANPEGAVVLGPSSFRLADRQEAFDRFDDDTPKRWRMRREQLNEWRDTLEARIDQRDQVDASIREAVDRAEADTLASLRDALVERLDKPVPNSTVNQKAEWASERLLMDTESGGCRETTRVSQATQSLQTLLFSLDTGQDVAGAASDLQIKDDDFDQRWEWIGSYARWKSAMGVSLYSENLLQPSLRRWQTPKFDELTSKLRGGDAASVGLADAVDSYQTYLQDIDSLELQAACWGSVDTKLSGGAGSLPELPAEDSLLFLFARGGSPETGYRLYWSVYNPGEQNPAKAQTFWQEIPGTAVTETLGRDDAGDVVGAVPYISEHSKYICVFIQREVEGSDEIVLSRFDLSTATWDRQTPTELGVPDESDFDLTEVVPVQATDRADIGRPPRVILSYGGMSLYLRRLNEEATAWADSVEPDPMYNFRRDTVFIKKFDDNIVRGDSSIRFPKYFDGDYENAKKALNKGKVSGNLRDAFDKVDWPLSEDLDISNKGDDGKWDIWDSGNGIGYDIADTDEELKISPEPHNDVPKWGGKAFDSGGGAFRPLGAFAEGSYGSEFAFQFIFGNYNKTWVAQVTEDVDSSELRVEFWEDRNPVAGGREIQESNFVGAHNFGSGDPTIFWQPDPSVASNYKHTIGSGDIDTDAYNIIGSIPRICGSPDSELDRSSTPFFPFDWSGWGLSLVVSPYSDSGDFDAANNEPLAPNQLEEFGTTPAEAQQTPPEDRESATASEYARQNQVFEEYPTRRTNITYLDEAHYFLPLAIARYLQSEQRFSDALDWYRILYEYGDQTQAYPFESLGEGTPEHDPGVLTDVTLDGGLNPHAVARRRPNTAAKYEQYTILSIVRCLLDYADEEFTQDTSASVERARVLYETALDTLGAQELDEIDDPCGELEVGIRDIVDEIVNDDSITMEPWVRRELETINDVRERQQLASRLENIELDDDEGDGIDQVREAFAEVNSDSGDSSSVRTALERSRTAELTTAETLLTSEAVAKASAKSADRAVSYSDGSSTATEAYDATIQSVSYAFCLPANPILEALRQRANMNLKKIRTCRNFAGMKRELEPYAVSTDAESAVPELNGDIAVNGEGGTTIEPTEYRYDALIERTKELLDLAQNIESSFLSAIQNRDEEEYKLLDARQGLETARAGVRLQRLRVNKAEERLDISELQQQRAALRANRYGNWVSGLKDFEDTDTYSYLKTARDLTMISAAVSGIASVAGAIAGGFAGASTGPQGIAGGGVAGAALGAIGNLGGTSQALQGVASWYRTKATIEQRRASRRRRRQRWKLQRDLANKDTRIASERVDLAEDQIDIAEQQREISELETDHAEETVEFLRTEQFTTAELFDWMADVLEGVYRYFLQQATSMAKLAEQQVAFERQELPQRFIQDGYWRAPRDGRSDVSPDENGVDRRGLTGSARLLRDVYELDQYAFRTDERKQQVSKTISLSRVAPFELQQFRETGVLSFDTYRELFERDHPGHHLRLIKNVSVSVIALTPPTDGISAELTNDGISRTVTGGPPFRETVIRRDPETITLSSAQNETGVFELKPDGDKLAPFEKTGVDTSWELSMPKAANQFDYDTIADVLLTVNYTALNNPTYRKRVIKQLDPEQSGQRAFRFSEEFADQWYDLHNPEQTNEPLTVQFETDRSDFPPNMTDVEIEDVMLYYVTADGAETEELDTTLRFKPTDGQGQVGGTATPVEHRISTRQGNGSSWTPMVGESVDGEWELSLSVSPETKALFTEEQIDDILFVVDYEGRTPEWPN